MVHSHLAPQEAAGLLLNEMWPIGQLDVRGGWVWGRGEVGNLPQGGGETG